MNRPPRFIPPLGPPKRNAQQQILAQWRGVDLGPMEKVRGTPARPARGVVDKVLQELRIDRRQSETEILKVWNHLLDPTLTAHAQPTGICRGTLFVNVDSSVWMDEIVRYRRRGILERLQHAFGKDLIQRISFRLG